MPQVTALGQALSSADLKGSTFVVAGHTDGKGTDTYNQSLSERRADAVKRYLMEKYRVDESNLVTVGYGKSQLKDSSNPLASENRRVQVINMAN
jgi:outer membrane protein OmpA-like peptidoglycan-associated protein